MKPDDVIWSAQLRADEYPDDVLRYMARRHCQAAVNLRGFSGVPMTPGPVIANFVRFEPVKARGARHNVGEDIHAPERESDAGDYFIPDDRVARFIKYAEADANFGGFGLYFDTKPSVMVHLDNRPERVKWLRVAGEYIDYNVDPIRYYSVLADELKKLPTQRG